MADVTYSDFQLRVARKLGIIHEAESLDANYAATIIDGILSIQAQIDRQGVASFDLANGVDYPYVDSLAEIVAAELVNDFQIPDPLKSQIYGQGKWGLPGRSPAERRLRDLLDGTTQKIRVKHDLTAI